MEKFTAKIGDIIQFPTMSECKCIKQSLRPINTKGPDVAAYLLPVKRNCKPDWLLLGITIVRPAEIRWAYRLDYDLLGEFMTMQDVVNMFAGRTIRITRLLNGLDVKSYVPVIGDE